MGPEQARTAVERLLLRRWHEREKLIVRLPLARLDIRPGSLVRLPGEPDILEVISSTVESSTVVLELRRSRQDLPLSLDGDPGRAIVPADVIGDPTRLLLVEPPALGDAPLSEPVLVLAASGGQVPWRTVGIELSTDGYTEQAHARRRAVLGEACTELFPGQASLIDRINHVDVQLAGPDDWLNSCDDATLASGANLALLGDELLQFGRAEPLQPGKFRLSRLVRGRFGSEWATRTHKAGEPFLLIETASLVSLTIPLATLGGEITATPGGAADGDAAAVRRTITGEAVRPPSPVHLTATRTATGELLVRWVPRDRRAWVWLNEAGHFEATDQRRYEVELAGSAGRLTRLCTSAECRFEPHELEAVGSDPMCSVSQLGDPLPSRKASIPIQWSRS